MNWLGIGKQGRCGERSSHWELVIEEGSIGWEFASREGIADLGLTSADRSVGRELTSVGGSADCDLVIEEGLADWEFASRDRVPSGAVWAFVLGAVTFFGHGKSACWPVRGSADWELVIEEGLAGWELASREGMVDLGLTSADRSGIEQRGRVS